MRIFQPVGALVLASLGVAGAASAGPDTSAAEQVQAANMRFEDVTSALAEGYTAIPCADGFDGPVATVHYMNARYLQDEVPDVARPQGLLYEPGGDGRLTLVAVEYVTVAGPVSLAGQPFKFVRKPDRYRLVVWAWKPEADSLFADASPDPACE
jgi:hypothetical protein